MNAEGDEGKYTLITDGIWYSYNQCQVNCVIYGEELLEFLSSTNDHKVEKKNNPDITLLDLNMPKKDGREALQEIKSQS